LIGTETLDAKAVGSTQLEPGQVLSTENGKAEVLLTPGVFLRLGDNSSVKMISPSLTNTRVELEKGHAEVEVAEIHNENDLQVTEDNVTAQLLKKGVYDFNADQAQIRVFDGQAKVSEDGKQIDVKGGHELDLNAGGSLKAKKFDKKEYASEDDLYRWSSLRSSYLAEANVQLAPSYATTGFVSGWYWDPWFGGYTFIPGSGLLYSPFGWGFYSPWAVYGAPYGYFGYYGPYYRYHYYRPGPYYGHDHRVVVPPAAGFHPPAGNFHPPAPHAPAPHVSAGFSGGFHGGVGGFHSSR